MKRYIPLLPAVATPSTLAQQPPIEHVLVSVPLHKQAAETALTVTVFSGDEPRRMASTPLATLSVDHPAWPTRRLVPESDVRLSPAALILASEI